MRSLFVKTFFNYWVIFFDLDIAFRTLWARGIRRICNDWNNAWKKTKDGWKSINFLLKIYLLFLLLLNKIYKVHRRCFTIFVLLFIYSMLNFLGWFLPRDPFLGIFKTSWWSWVLLGRRCFSNRPLRVDFS